MIAYLILSHRYPNQFKRLFRAIYHPDIDLSKAPADYRNAAAVLLATGAGDDILLAHELAAVAAIRGDRPARKILARALDAFLISIGQPQRYGTVQGAALAPSVSGGVRAKFDMGGR